jgi:hypothetical protein
MDPSLRANGSRECAPDDRLREAIQSHAQGLDCFVALVLAMTESRKEARMPGNRNLLFLVIGALIVVVGLLGYNLYQTKKQPEGLQINVGPSGLKIQNK